MSTQTLTSWLPPDADESTGDDLVAAVAELTERVGSLSADLGHYAQYTKQHDVSIKAIQAHNFKDAVQPQATVPTAKATLYTVNLKQLQDEKDLLQAKLNQTEIDRDNYYQRFSVMSDACGDSNNRFNLLKEQFDSSQGDNADLRARLEAKEIQLASKEHKLATSNDMIDSLLAQLDAERTLTRTLKAAATTTWTAPKTPLITLDDRTDLQGQRLSFTIERMQNDLSKLKTMVKTVKDDLQEHLVWTTSEPRTDRDEDDDTDDTSLDTCETGAKLKPLPTNGTAGMMLIEPTEPTDDIEALYCVLGGECDV